MSKIQIIEQEGRPAFAVVPYGDYEELLEKAEMLEDIRDAARIQAAIAEGGEEMIPADVVDRLLSGVHPLTVWREYRSLSMSILAGRCGVSHSAISQIESGKKEPSVRLLKNLAAALQVDMDDLLPNEAQQKAA